MIRRRRRRQMLAVGGLLLMLVSLWLLAGLERRLKPVLTVMALRQAEIIGVETLGESLSQHVGDVSYQDLIVLQHDQQGRIAFMQVNTTTINRLAADLQQAMQRDLKNLHGTVVQVPLGTALGGGFFSAYGPRLKVRIVPVGTVRVTLDQDFAHAGINQTRHTIYLNAQTRMQVAIPLHQESIKVETRTPLVEAIIVGPVPQQYLNLNWSGLPWHTPTPAQDSPLSRPDAQSDADLPAPPGQVPLSPAPSRR